MAASNRTTYSDVVINAFQSVQAWRSLALVLVGVLIFETIALAWLAGQRNVLLIPQHLSNIKEPVNLNLGEPFSPEYLTAVAKGDAFALLNWTPENIDQQYGLFMSRLTPELYVAQKESLLTELKTHKEESVTQSFHVMRSFVSGASVTLHGVLIRFVAGREVFRGAAAYELAYTNLGNGLLMIARVSQPEVKADVRQAVNSNNNKPIKE